LWLYYVYLKNSFFWKKRESSRSSEYTICIVTYCKRFRNNLKPLVKALKKTHPNTEIIIGVNGYHNQQKQQRYIRRFDRFISQYQNIRWFSYVTGQSISKMWNNCILKASNNMLLVLNDDVLITPDFQKEIDQVELDHQSIKILNKSWSHFFLSKNIIQKVGWFDERFLGVGNEDCDYEFRAQMEGIETKSIQIDSIVNLVVKTRDFSFSKNEKVINEKYSHGNWEFFQSKWSVSKEIQDGFIPTRFSDIPYVKLNEGMETPNFYENISLLIN